MECKPEIKGRRRVIWELSRCREEPVVGVLVVKGQKRIHFRSENLHLDLGVSYVRVKISRLSLLGASSWKIRQEQVVGIRQARVQQRRVAEARSKDLVRGWLRAVSRRIGQQGNCDSLRRNVAPETTGTDRRIPSVHTEVLLIRSASANVQKTHSKVICFPVQKRLLIGIHRREQLLQNGICLC